MTREPMNRFEDEWKQWAGQPPETSPARAAREVLERLGAPRFPSASSVRWLAAAALFVLALGVFYLAPTSPETLPPEETAEIPPLDEGVVLFWLDPETPLYMTWNPPRADKGDAP